MATITLASAQRLTTLTALPGDIVEGNGAIVTGHRGNWKAAAVTIGKGATVRNLRILDNESVGVSMGEGAKLLDSEVARNGLLGVCPINGAKDIVIEGCDIHHNNYGLTARPTWWEDATQSGAIATQIGALWFGQGANHCGGVKICGINGQDIRLNPTVRRNRIHDNRGPGLWFDVRVMTGLVEWNEVWGQRGVDAAWQGTGIQSEICNPWTGAGDKYFYIRNNYVRDNEGAGIYLMETQGVIVENNVVANDSIEFRDNWPGGKRIGWLKDCIIRNNVLFNGGVPKENAARGLVVVANVFPTSRPTWTMPGGTTPPVVPPVTPPVTPTVPAGAIQYGPDNFGHVWHVSGGILYRNRIKLDGAPVLEAFTLAGFFWQRTQYGFHKATADGWESVTPTDPRPTTPPADNPEIAKLKARIAALDIDLQEANDAIDKLGVELTAANATITTLRGRLATIKTTAELP